VTLHSLSINSVEDVG